MASPYSPVDTGYSWVVLVAAFCLNLLLNAGAGGMGVLLVELMGHFNVKKSVIVWIGGILVSVGFMLSFLIGWLLKRFGCRIVGCAASLVASLSLILSSEAKTVTHLFITYGFMLGIASAVFFNISNIAVQQYFEKRRTLAQGTLMAGLSAGLFIWPPLTRLFIDLYGWRGAMLLHGAIQLNGLVLCALIRPVNRPKVETQIIADNKIVSDDKLQMKQNVDDDDEHGVSTNGVKTENVSLMQTHEAGDKDKDSNGIRSGAVENHRACTLGAKCCKSMFKVTVIYPHFMLYIVAIIFVQSANVMPYTLTPARADALGIDKNLGAYLVSISAGISGVFRIISGFVGDQPWVNKLVMCGLSGIVGGVLTAVSVVPNTFLGLAIVFGFIALPSASYMATFGSAAVDIVGKKYLQQGVALMSMSFGLAQFTTFLVTGWITDALGDPKYSFLIFGIVEVIGGFFFLAAYVADKRFKCRLQTRSPVEDTKVVPS